MNLRCPLCDYEIDEDDISIGYCSVCGETIKKSNEVNKMAKKKKKGEET